MSLPAKNFILQQLVPRDVYEALGVKAWDLLQQDAVTTLDQLYDYFGPMTVNNWHTAGPFSQSGYRSPDSKTGAPLSQHRKGNAFDPKPLKIKAKPMFDYIVAHPEQFPLLTTLEEIAVTGPRGWVHFDCRKNPQPGIRIIKV